MGLLDKIWRFATGTSGRQEIPSKPTRQEAEKILTDELVVQYKPGAHYTGMGASAAAPNMSRFFLDVEEMVSHPAISHPLNSFKSGIANAVFEVEDASSPEHAEFALSEAKHFWSRCLRDAQASYQYGRGGCEIVYSREDGALKLASLQAVMPLDARVLLKAHDYAGIRIKGSGPTYDLWGPRPGMPAKGWWKVHDRRYHRWYGFPQIYPAWRPWRRMAGRDGAEEVTDGAVYRFAYAPPIGRFPEEDNQPNARLNPGGVVFTNRGKMQEMLECLKAGGQVALSSRRDERSNEYVWDLKWPDKVLDVSGLIEYTADLERACSLGCGWPPELTQASETGSGYSGRAIPLEVYYVGQQCQAEDMLEAWHRQIGEPLLQWNFGPSAWVRLKVGNILESRMKAMGPQSQPPPPGQGPPGQPGQQPPEQPGRPPAGQMFSTTAGLYSEDDVLEFATRARARKDGEVWQAANGLWFRMAGNRPVRAKAPGAPVKAAPKAKKEVAPKKAEPRERIELSDESTAETPKSAPAPSPSSSVSEPTKQAVAHAIGDLPIASVPELRVKLAKQLPGKAFDETMLQMHDDGLLQLSDDGARASGSIVDGGATFGAAMPSDKLRAMASGKPPAKATTSIGDLEKAASPIMSGLSAAEKQTIRKYADMDFKPINNALNKGATPTPEAQKSIGVLDAIFDKVPAFDRPVNVNRFIQIREPKDLEAFVANLQSKGEFVSPGFSSTSADPKYAERFKGHVGVSFDIEATKGLYIEGETSTKGEHEVLLPRNQRFEVGAITRQGNQYKIALKQVGDATLGKAISTPTKEPAKKEAPVKAPSSLHAAIAEKLANVDEKTLAKIAKLLGVSAPAKAKPAAKPKPAAQPASAKVEQVTKAIKDLETLAMSKDSTQEDIVKGVADLHLEKMTVADLRATAKVLGQRPNSADGKGALIQLVGRVAIIRKEENASARS